MEIKTNELEVKIQQMRRIEKGNSKIVIKADKERAEESHPGIKESTVVLMK